MLNHLEKLEKTSGELRAQDQIKSGLLTWTPAIMTALAIVPLPVLFIVLFLTSTGTDSAAFYLLLAIVSLGLGLVMALLISVMFWFWRRRWNRRLRDRLAADGVTVNELTWFDSELSTEEKKTWREIKDLNPLLADAYAETLAARLTATRISARARSEILRIERQINRTHHLRNVNTNSLINDLRNDRQQAEIVRKEAQLREDQARAQLQSIDAAARRELNQVETNIMLERLSITQEQMPLALEIARLEQEARNEVATRPHKDLTKNLN